jgi:hypothetical protein
VKFARCSRCKHYFLISHLIRVECTSCDYRSYRCKTKECGGHAGAMRSILCHFHWWRSRGEGEGGHDRVNLLNSLRSMKRHLKVA